jgi:hypothetical protein
MQHLLVKSKHDAEIMFTFSSVLKQTHRISWYYLEFELVFHMVVNLAIMVLGSACCMYHVLSPMIMREQ